MFIAGKAATCLAGVLFSLAWTHSVEKTQWVEHWRVVESNNAPTLSLDLTKVKGSGAGIDPAPHAQWVDGWYQWQPATPLAVPQLILANSELTPDNWKLCSLEEKTLQTKLCIDFSSFKPLQAKQFSIIPKP